MSIAPFTKLAKKQQQELLDDLNYLNLGEIKSFCKRHSIPYTIAVETKEHIQKKTAEDDRKGVILGRVRHFLRTGVVLKETCFPVSVVADGPLPEKITPDDRLFYGQYDKTNRRMIGLLKELTDGRFKDGALARILAREFWTKGQAPTFSEFASSWLKATRGHEKPNPEWAFLRDRSNNLDVFDWKKVRTRKALTVINILDRITTE